VAALQELLFTDVMGTALWLWAVFLCIVITVLVIDLGILNRDHHEISVSNSLCLSAGYMSIAFLFGAWIWWQFGSGRALEFYTGYLVEQSLSMDNLFVMAVVFAYFGVPRAHQHQVLFWGILGVIVFRAIMIGLGAALIHQFEWILYVFGVFLLATGVRMLFSREIGQPDLDNNWMIRMLRQHLRFTDQFHEGKFFVRLQVPGHDQTLLHATPLFLALIVIELADIVFAVDSVPAVFAITQDTFIVYTSNIFAVLGLRSLYFALAELIHRFVYMKYALAIVLVFIGGKIFLVNFIGKIPPVISLGVTLGVLLGGVVLSLLKTRKGRAS
jgi:tellurite resistance protein TerC